MEQEIIRILNDRDIEDSKKIDELSSLTGLRKGVVENIMNEKTLDSFFKSHALLEESKAMEGDLISGLGNFSLGDTKVVKQKQKRPKIRRSRSRKPTVDDVSDLLSALKMTSRKRVNNDGLEQSFKKMSLQFGKRKNRRSRSKKTKKSKKCKCKCRN